MGKVRLIAYEVYTEAERNAQLTWKTGRKLGNSLGAHKTSGIQVEFQTRRWGGLIQPDPKQPETISVLVLIIFPRWRPQL